MNIRERYKRAYRFVRQQHPLYEERPDLEKKHNLQREVGLAVYLAASGSLLQRDTAAQGTEQLARLRQAALAEAELEERSPATWYIKAALRSRQRVLPGNPAFHNQLTSYLETCGQYRFVQRQERKLHA